jgi:Flp pilus assembly pilin Flp
MPRHACESVPYREVVWFHIERDHGHTAPCRPRLKLGLVNAMFGRFLKALQSEDRGQDLAEYCLLTALAALIVLGIIVQASGGVQAVWNGANASLAAGNAAGNSSPAAADVSTSAPSH